MPSGLAIADAGPQERFRVFVFVGGQQPVRNRIPRLRRERHDMAGAGLFLADRELMDDVAVVVGDVDDAQGKQVGGAQHGIDRHIEQGEIPDFAFGREQGSDDRALLGRERSHLADGFILVPGLVLNFGFLLHAHKSQNSIGLNECKALFYKDSLFWLLSKAEIGARQPAGRYITLTRLCAMTDRSLHRAPRCLPLSDGLASESLALTLSGRPRS